MVFLVRAFKWMVPESRHLSYYARVNDKVTATIEVFFFSGNSPTCHTETQALIQCLSPIISEQNDTMWIYICREINDSWLRSQHLCVFAAAVVPPLWVRGLPRLFHLYVRFICFFYTSLIEILSFTWPNQHLTSFVMENIPLNIQCIQFFFLWKLIIM